MASETSDPLEAGLIAKVAAWTAALESYRAAKAVEGTSDAAVGAAAGGRPTDLPVGVFRDKGVKEAIPIYLGAVRRKQTNKEIATGLIKGGIATTSDNFEATVGTALLRLKKEGIVLRFADGWDLAASYPDSLKNRLEKDSKSSPKKSNGRKKSSPKSAKRKQPQARTKTPRPIAKEPPEKRGPRPSGAGLQQRVKEYLVTRQGQFTTVDELVAQLRVPNVQVLRLVLGKLSKHNVIEKNPDGLVRLIKKVA